MTRNLRLALMGTVTTTALMAFASPAAAQCVVTPAATPVTGTVTCDTTTTVDATYDTTVNQERNYDVDTSSGDVTATVGADAVVDGYGLAFTNTVGGANTLAIVNDGSIEIDPGLAASAGGNAALNVTLTGATDLDYSGAGDIFNMGIAGDGLNVISTGTGSVNAVVGGSVAGATGGSGIFIDKTSAGAGDINLTTTADETVEGDLYGVVAAINNVGATGDITVNNAADVSSMTADNTIQIGVAGQTTGTGDVTVNNTGSVGSETDSASYVAVGGAILNAASTGTVTVTNGDGDVYGDVGVGASTAGDGAIVVETGLGTVNGVTAGVGTFTSGDATTDITTGTGAVSASAGNAIDVSGGIGDVTIVSDGEVTGSNSGMQVVSLGDQSITANDVVYGDTVAGIHSDTTGNRMITIGADGDVSGAAEAILLTNTGTAMIDNSGVIGAASTDLALNAAAAGDVTFTNNADGVLNGHLTFGAGDDLLTNAGTFNTEGSTDFGAGTDAFVNTGTLNLTGDTTFLGLESTDLGGTVNLDSYTLTGSGDLDLSGTVNSDGGTLTGFTSLSNSGDLYLAGVTTVDPVPFTNTGTVYSVDGDATLTGQTVFNNLGTIDMVDNAADDSLTIDSDFVGGTGSTLAVDVDDAVADMLIVNGDISGTTTVDANIVGTGALIDGGVQFVDGQGASTANAFVLGSVMGGSPLIDYMVDQDGSDYYLSSTFTSAAFEPMAIGAAAMDVWYPSADEVIANLAVPYKGSGLGFWAQGYMGHDKWGDRDNDVTIDGVNYSFDDRVNHKRYGIQAGVDYGLGETGRVGLTAGYGHHKFGGMSDLNLNGWNFGAYGAFGGTVGLHGEALFKYDRYKGEFRDGVFDNERTRVRATGVDGSVGYRMGMGGEDSSLDLSVGASYVSTKIRDFSVYGLRYGYDNFDSTRGRASARYNLGGALQPYVQGTVYHEFADGGTMDIFDGVDTYSIDNRRKGTWGRIEGGLGGSPNRFPTLAAWADFGHMKGFGARLGMRFGGEAVAPPPPPPPPPPAPEPAPATQTCYDGSVILATDTCPVPPPPPPPPPAPERG